MAIRNHKSTKSRHLLRRALLCVALACCLIAGTAAWSVVGALRAPGTDSIPSRLAEWGRDHHLSALVTWLEEQDYKAHPPKLGGLLDPAQRALLGGAGSGLRPAIAPFALPAQPGEGAWRAVTRVHGRPALQEAFLRPDQQHTSYLAAVVWIDHRTARFELHPGYAEPGHGAWSRPDLVPAGRRLGLLATWNGGFKIQDAHGGFYLDGRTAGTLRPGAASEVFYADGSLTVGAWGGEVRMGPTVVGVRQNLDLLVDGGAVVPAVDRGTERDWGLSMHGASFVWRSGLGVTAAGDLLYVCGPALSVSTLARILQRAGAIRAMQLDINPSWVSFMTYGAPGRADPAPQKLLAFPAAANRYLVDSSRDFTAAYAR